MAIAIVQELRELDRTSTGREKVVAFVKKLESLKTWEEILKLLLVSHRALLAESTSFLSEFKLHSYKNIQDLPNHIKDLSNRYAFIIADLSFSLEPYVRCCLTKYYFTYIKTYSDHYFALSKALAINSSITDAPKIDLNTLENYEEVKKLLLVAFKVKLPMVELKELRQFCIRWRIFSQHRLK